MKKREKFMAYSFAVAAAASDLGRVLAASIGTICGATGAPGRTRCRPLTTIFSPGLEAAAHHAQAVDRSGPA
jgi:hypothetical protein